MFWAGRKVVGKMNVFYSGGFADSRYDAETSTLRAWV